MKMFLCYALKSLTICVLVHFPLPPTLHVSSHTLPLLFNLNTHTHTHNFFFTYYVFQWRKQACRGQRTTFRSWFFPPACETWGLNSGNKLGSKCLDQPSHSDALPFSLRCSTKHLQSLITSPPAAPQHCLRERLSSPRLTGLGKVRKPPKSCCSMPAEETLLAEEASKPFLSPDQLLLCSQAWPLPPPHLPHPRHYCQLQTLTLAFLWTNASR